MVCYCTLGRLSSGIKNLLALLKSDGWAAISPRVWGPDCQLNVPYHIALTCFMTWLMPTITGEVNPHETDRGGPLFFKFL